MSDSNAVSVVRESSLFNFELYGNFRPKLSVNKKRRIENILIIHSRRAFLPLPPFL